MKNSDKKPEGEEKSYLSWKRADYEAAGIEIPECLVSDSLHTEGELMSENEIVAWIIDSNKTFQIIKEEYPERYETLYRSYLKDLSYLVKIGKIDPDDIDTILNL